MSLVAVTTPVAPVTGLGEAGAPGSPGVGGARRLTAGSVTVTESNVETLRTDGSPLVTTSPV